MFFLMMFSFIPYLKLANIEQVKQFWFYSLKRSRIGKIFSAGNTGFRKVIAHLEDFFPSGDNESD